MDLIIGFSKARSPWKIGSKVIALSEDREYSHAYIRFPHPSTGSHMVAQASNGMVNMENYQYFIVNNVIVKEYKITCSDVMFNQIVLRYVTESLGKPYGYMDLILIAIKKAFHFEIKLADIMDFAICSQFAASICQLFGMKVSDAINYVTPSDLETILINNNIPRYV